MGLNTLIKSTSFTLKMYRLYWMNLLAIMVVLPLTYLAVIVLFSGGVSESLEIGLTGFIIMTCFTTMVYPVAIQVANTFEEQVLEVYASLPVSLRELIASIVISQLLFAAPSAVIGVIALKLLVNEVNVLYVLISIAFAILFFSSIAVLLGLIFKSRYKLDSILTLLIMVIVIATPLYYRLKAVQGLWKVVLLVNPVTHLVCLLRAGVGLAEPVPTELSMLYLVGLSIVLITLVLYKTRKGALTVLERR